MTYAKTKRQCEKNFNRLAISENLEFDISDEGPYEVILNSHTSMGHGRFWVYALQDYVGTFTEFDDAYYHITDLKQKRIFLIRKLEKFKPDYKEFIAAGIRTIYI